MALTDSWNGREDGIQLGGFEHLCNPTGLVSPPRLCQDDSNETGQQQPGPHAPSCTAPPCLPKCPTRADFKDIHVLGSGSFGDVMLAVNRCTGQKVALKTLSKKRLNTEKRFEHAMNERRTLELTSSPFTTKLICAFQDRQNLYLALEYVEYGELFHLLQAHGPLQERHARFYAAQIAVALCHLHEHKMVHRDIKPENILIDARGYCKLTDFGFCKVVEDRTYSVCGTPEYTAPEIVLGVGYGRGVDWWSFGILMFELVSGHSPFKNPLQEVDQRHLLLKKIVDGKVRYPKKFTKDLRHLLGGLLSKDPVLRCNVADSMRDHPWFTGMAWDAVTAKTIPPPLRPSLPLPLVR